MVRAVMVAQRIVSLENVPDSPCEGKVSLPERYFDRSMSERQRKMAFMLRTDGVIKGERAVRASKFGLRRLGGSQAAWEVHRGRGWGPNVHLHTRHKSLEGRGALVVLSKDQ